MTQPQYAPINPYPLPGEVLDGKYRIEHLLGEGGMGAVAKATHMLRRAPVALKFMSPAVLALQGAVERFVNEGVAASQIDSDHVVKVFDVGRMPNGAPYLVMEYLDGCDLGQLLVREGGLLEPTRVVHFGLQILRALQTAHASGIIHRDMKPSNCFVIDKDAEPDFVKLVDFGISKVRSDDVDGRSANLTRTNSALGTPLYMSPEQARSPRDVDQRTDLYSVGAMLYELLTGRTPYTAESGEYTEILFKIFTTEPQPLRSLRPEVSDGLAAVVHHALVRDPDMRFSSASEMAEALTPFADDRSSQVITRIRGGRGRSGLPPSPPNAPPLPGAMSAPGGQANPFTATGSGAVPATRVPTDVGMGVTREPSAPEPAAARANHAPLIIAFAVLVLLCAVGGVVVVRRSALVTLPATHDSAGTTGGGASGTTDREHSLPALPSTMPLPTAALEPLPSATALPSPSAVGPSSGAASAPTPTASGKVHAPQNLNGVQPHF
jgi:eukaryotic-like serine/threonine-protein kinase